MGLTRSGCLKAMRRLLPSVARREAYARRCADGSCEVGFDVRSGRGDALAGNLRETHAVARAGSWGEALRKAREVLK